MTHNRIPAFEMPSGAVLYVQYDKEKDNLDVGTVTNAGLSVMHQFPYDHDFSLDSNLQGVSEKLNEMPEYQEQEQEEYHFRRAR